MKPDRLFGVHEAHRAFVEALVLAGEAGVQIDKLYSDYVLLCRCLTQLMLFCARNPKLPASHLFTLYLECWLYVRGYPYTKQPPKKIQRGTWKALRDGLEGHICLGGNVMSRAEAAKISGVHSDTIGIYFPTVQHLVLAVLEAMIESKR